MLPDRQNLHTRQLQDPGSEGSGGGIGLEGRLDHSYSSLDARSSPDIPAAGADRPGRHLLASYVCISMPNVTTRWSSSSSLRLSRRGGQKRRPVGGSRQRGGGGSPTPGWEPLLR